MSIDYAKELDRAIDDLHIEESSYEGCEYCHNERLVSAAYAVVVAHQRMKQQQKEKK